MKMITFINGIKIQEIIQFEKELKFEKKKKKKKRSNNTVLSSHFQ